VSGPGDAVLLLDAGNRRLKTGRWTPGGGLVAGPVLALEEDWEEALRRAGCPRPWPGRVWVSCTRPELRGRLEALAPGAVSFAGEGGWPFPVRSRGTGSDRILAARAAWLRTRRGGRARPVAVADLGSAWTLDLMDVSGAFLGGAIGPGLGAQEEALARATPHLPAPAPDPVPPGPPDATAAALAAGTRGALAAALEALLAAWEPFLGEEPARFLTGGDAERLQAWLRRPWFRARGLVLEGLAALAADAA